MSDRQQTLMSCTACEGAGRTMQDLPGGRYRALACRFCAGTGMMTRTQERAYREHLDAERAKSLRAASGDSDPYDRPSTIFADAVVHPTSKRPPR